VSVKGLRSRPITPRPRTLWRRLLIGSAAAVATLVAAGIIVFAWYDHATSGAGDDTDLVARSLHHVLISNHPAQRLVTVRCDGLRDGSDFFGCQVSRRGQAVARYSVSYSDKTHLYRAEDDPRSETLEFEPSK